LTFSGILHVAIGVNFALLRKRLKTKGSKPIKSMVSQTRRDSIVLIAGTAVTLFSALYLGSLTKLSSVVEKVANLLPPGQYEVASLRRLHVGLPEPFNEETWTLKVEGLVENPLTLN
jgi:DMSO/TMAO reductase YedYZ molybdopterin-dependent catalytic subunit